MNEHEHWTPTRNTKKMAGIPFENGIDKSRRILLPFVIFIISNQIPIVDGSHTNVVRYAEIRGDKDEITLSQKVT